MRAVKLVLALALGAVAIAEAAPKSRSRSKPRPAAAAKPAPAPAPAPALVAATPAPVAPGAKPKPRRAHVPDAYFVLQKELAAQLAAGDLEKAEEACRAQILLRPERGLPYYNLATVHARRGHLDRAFESLFRAADKGFAQVELLRSDPELAVLHTHPMYPHLIEQMSRAGTTVPGSVAGGSGMGPQPVARAAH